MAPRVVVGSPAARKAASSCVCDGSTLQAPPSGLITVGSGGAPVFDMSSQRAVHDTSARSEVVDRAAVSAAEAVPAVLGVLIHVQARRLIVVQRAANLARAPNPPAGQPLDTAPAAENARDRRARRGGAGAASRRRWSAESRLEGGARVCQLYAPAFVECEQAHGRGQRVLSVQRSGWFLQGCRLLLRTEVSGACRQDDSGVTDEGSAGG